jgi:hypothetical protein
VHFWLLWLPWSWSSDLDVGGRLSLLEEDVDEVLVLVLFGEDDLRVVGGGGGWSLDQDDVGVAVSAWDPDNSGLPVLWLIGSGEDVHVLVVLWGVWSSSVLLGGGSGHEDGEDLRGFQLLDAKMP